MKLKFSWIIITRTKPIASAPMRTADTEFVTILIYVLKPNATIAYSHPCSNAIRPVILDRALLFSKQNLTNSKYPSLRIIAKAIGLSAVYDNAEKTTSFALK